MTTPTEIEIRPEVPAALARSMDKADSFTRDAVAPNTRRAYDSDWKTFAAWCDARGEVALPAHPEIVKAYLSDRANPDEGAPAALSTLRRALTAINLKCAEAGYPKPSTHEGVRKVMRGIARREGAKPTRKAAATTDIIQAMLAALPDNLKGTRDRALILLGMAGAFRRGELVALNVSDLDFTAAGLVVTIRQSKTDQTGKGATVAIAYGSNLTTCPVRSLKAWLDAASVTDGPVFRSVTRHGRLGESMTGRTVARVVKAAAAAVPGLDAATFGAHSLRAGHATQARRGGAGRWAIKRQGRWKSDAVVEGYVREVDQWEDNTSTMLGL